MDKGSFAQVEVNGHGPVSTLGMSAKAEANGSSPAAKAASEPKADEAAEFWAALQGKQQDASGTAEVCIAPCRDSAASSASKQRHLPRQCPCHLGCLSALRQHCPTP